MKTILFIFGTRPEAIKFAPVIEMINTSKILRAVVCSTGQHREMLQEFIDYFNISLDYNLDTMRKNQSLGELTAALLLKLGDVIDIVKPELVFVQGDTTTTLAGSLSAFYNKVKIAHLEAGLRTYNKYSPFPEEINRVITSRIVDYHFVPTDKSKNNLLTEGVPVQKIFMVGNSVIDALLITLEKVKKLKQEEIIPELDKIDKSKKLILVTGHRRESFGNKLLEICNAIYQIAEDNNVEIVYPVHYNPNVRRPVYSILKNRKNIHLIPPLSYPAMIYLMSKCYLILTDSGGIQEEAPTLKKPVLVMRDVTERMEGIECNVSKIVGTNKKKIVSNTQELLYNKKKYQSMTKAENPYGSGTTSIKIKKILENIFKENI